MPSNEEVANVIKGLVDLSTLGANSCENDLADKVRRALACVSRGPRVRVGEVPRQVVLLDLMQPDLHPRRGDSKALQPTITGAAASTAG